MATDRLENGLLIYDDSNRPLKQKILAAATKHRRKYGVWPNLCHVHPSMLKGRIGRVNDIIIIGRRATRPNNFWLGVKEKEGDGQD